MVADREVQAAPRAYGEADAALADISAKAREEAEAFEKSNLHGLHTSQ